MYSKLTVNTKIFDLKKFLKKFSKLGSFLSGFLQVWVF